MSNHSNAEVTITAEASIAKELFTYIEAVQGDSEFAIISEEALEDVEIPEDPTAEVVISGWATGKWSYSENNLKYYFAGRLAKSSWREDKASHMTFHKLVGAIKRKGGWFRIDYKDWESGAGFIDLGSMYIEKGDVDNEVPFVDSDTVDCSLENLMYHFDYDEYEAIDQLYGDEMNAALGEYRDAGGERGATDFIDDYSQEVYDETFNTERAAEIVAEEKKSSEAVEGQPN